MDYLPDHWLIDNQIVRHQERIKQDTEWLVMLALTVIAHEALTAYPDAAELAIHLDEEYQRVMEPGGLFDSRGKLLTSDDADADPEAAGDDGDGEPRDRSAALYERIERYCSLLTLDNESAWGPFARDVETHQRLKLGDAIGIELRPASKLCG
jgi:hypothetical protein